MTDYRALCAELLRELENCIAVHYGEGGTHHISAADAVIDRARAALAEPVAEGPTVMEIIELADEIEAAELGQVDFARAVIARWGNQPAPPAEGEVAELVTALRGEAVNCTCTTLTNGDLRRAADLLEQRHPAPVPEASGVYYEFVISDADYCTQAGGIAPTYAQALNEGQHYLAQYQQDPECGPHTLELRRVEVLPSDALPITAGEVE